MASKQPLALANEARDRGLRSRETGSNPQATGPAWGALLGLLSVMAKPHHAFEIP